jgi:hypothetical protein
MDLDAALVLKFVANLLGAEQNFVVVRSIWGSIWGSSGPRRGSGLFS